MYAGHIACCPLVSHGAYADGTDRQTRQMDRCHAVTLCFPLDAASIISNMWNYYYQVDIQRLLEILLQQL